MGSWQPRVAKPAIMQRKETTHYAISHVSCYSIFERERISIPRVLKCSFQSSIRGLWIQSLINKHVLHVCMHRETANWLRRRKIEKFSRNYRPENFVTARAKQRKGKLFIFRKFLSLNGRESPERPVSTAWNAHRNQIQRGEKGAKQFTLKGGSGGEKENFSP